MDGLELIPESIRQLYEVREWRHAIAILKNDFPEEWDDVMTVLSEFRLLQGDVEAPGGGKSLIAQKLDRRFGELGWVERSFVTSATVDTKTLETRTHKVDRFRNRVALEVE